MTLRAPPPREPDPFLLGLLAARELRDLAQLAVDRLSALGAQRAQLLWNSEPTASERPIGQVPDAFAPGALELLRQALRQNDRAETASADGKTVAKLRVLTRSKHLWVAVYYELPINRDEAGDVAREQVLFLLGSRLQSALHAERLRLDVDRFGQAEKLQRALFAISDLASADLDTREVLRGLHEIVGRLMYAENFFIVRYDQERDTLRFIYFADVKDPHIPDPDEYIASAEMEGSLTLAIIRHGKPVMGPSEQLREMLGVPRDETQGPDSEDWLGVPMLDEGVVRGAVVVQSYDPAVHYSEADRALLSYVAQHILTALARREAQEQLEAKVEERTRALRLEVEERQRAEKLQSALFRIAQLAGRDLGMTEFYAEVHRIVSELLDARNFYIALLTNDGQELEFPYSVDERDTRQERRILRRGLSEYVLRTAKPLLVRREQVEALEAIGEVKSVGTKSVCWLGVPLMISGQAIGLIAVQSYTPDYFYSARDEELLSFVSVHIANALERRSADESLHRAYADLEQRVAERTRELAHTNRELRDQISVRERMELKLKHEAFHDTLTGLPNRSHLLRRMGQALTRYREDERRHFAVLFLDLDRFKVVNDSVGHLVGDELLKEAAKRISRCVRDPDLVSRLGGDEFAILLENLGTREDAVAVAERVLHSFFEPMRIVGKEIFTSTSIGIAHVNPQYRNPEELLRDADVAMYRAKAGGRQRYALFDEQLREEAMQLLELESDLRRALQRQEFEPHYQPIVRLGDGGLVGYEALMRWRHPERGLCGPAEFLSLAEENGSLEQIDWQIYERVCLDLSQDKLGTDSYYISINVSPRHLRAADFDERLLELVARHKIRPKRLRLEVTEGALLENPDRVSETLGRLRDAGIEIMLDDFGTGYSSLSYLHRFPLQCLKIDRSFVSALKSGESGGSTAIVRAIRLLADSLGMEVVAEGIETEEQRYQLRLLGLTLGQGYLFARPAAAEDLAERKRFAVPA